MRILLAATPAATTLDPILAMACVLNASGHDVVVTTASVFRANVEATGARFVALSAGADMDLSRMDAIYPQRKNLAPGPPRLEFDFKHFLIDTIPPQFSGIDSLLQTFPAELIIVDTMFGGCLPFLLGARANRPAMAALPVSCPLLPACADVDEHVLEMARQRVDAMLDSFGAASLPATYLASLAGLHDLFLTPSHPGMAFPALAIPAGLERVGALSFPASCRLTTALAGSRRRSLAHTGTVASRDLRTLVELVSPISTARAGMAQIEVFIHSDPVRVPDSSPRRRAAGLAGGDFTEYDASGAVKG